MTLKFSRLDDIKSLHRNHETGLFDSDEIRRTTQNQLNTQFFYCYGVIRKGDKNKTLVLSNTSINNNYFIIIDIETGERIKVTREESI